MTTYSNKEKETLRRILQEIITETNGKVLPERIMEKAEKWDCPLTHYLDWDDAAIGRRHRLWQIRKLLQDVDL